MCSVPEVPAVPDVRVEEHPAGWQVVLRVPGCKAQTFRCASEEDAHRFAARLRRPAPARLPVAPPPPGAGARRRRAQARR